MKTDFDSWHDWFLDRYLNVPFRGLVTIDLLKRLYDEYYFCDCQSCQYRKAIWRGMPMHLTDACKLPVDRGGFDPIKMGLI